MATTTPNPTLDQPVVLIAHDGARTDTAGRLSRLPESPSQLASAFSRSGVNLFTQPVADPAAVAYVEIGGMTHFVIDRETTTGPLLGSTRFQLRRKPEA